MSVVHQEGVATVELPSAEPQRLGATLHADAVAFLEARGARREFGSRLALALGLAGLCLRSGAFAALALYRLRMGLSAAGHRGLARRLARLAAVVGGVRIGDEAWLEAGVAVPEGHVTITGRAELERGAVLCRGVEVRPRAGRAEAPSIGRKARIEGGASVEGGIRVGAGALVLPGAVVQADVLPFATVAGRPAQPVAGGGGERLREAPLTPEPPRHPPHPMAEHCEGARRARRRCLPGVRPGRAGRRRALLTIARDEGAYFPIWLRYYSRFFGPEDIHVLDHETSDGSLDGPGFVRVPVSHEGHSTTWMGAVVEDYHRELCDRYDVILKADVDEIIAPNPELGTLDQYLDRFDEEWVNALGYEVLHIRSLEPRIDLSRPVLAQRRYWYANDGYDKPVVSSGPMEWVPGFHGRADRRFALDPDLRLIHLHRMDFDLCRERHRLRSRWAWDPADLATGRGVQNRIVEPGAFERWFYEDAASEGVEIVIERIPPVWRNLV